MADGTLRAAAATTGGALIGMWLCSASPIAAEICGGSGVDWLLIDAEHSANDLVSVQLQLQVLRGWPPMTMVRVACLDTVLIKQYLDVGVQNLLVPMVSNALQARAAVAAMRYPPAGVRGVGAALSRVSEWGRVPDYLARAQDLLSLTVQIETAEAVDNVAEILATEGVDAIFVGPSDLAGSLGVLGQQGHPSVVEAVEHCIDTASAMGKLCGVNAFSGELARRYQKRGARFILVGADVTVLARGSEALASEFRK